MDWAHFGQVAVGRARRTLSCFVATLSWSRALYLEFLFDQTMENFLRGHVHAFDDWCGQPRVILYDNPFPTDLVLPVRAAKTIYVRFDLNDYSIPPEAVGRQLTLVASDTQVRILEGTAEIARHHRTYDRHQLVLDPAHQQAVLKTKRKAFEATPTGRLTLAAPESKTLLDLAFAQGESAGSQTAQLLKLLDLYGPVALRRAINEALERNTPRASSVAFLLRKQQRSAPAPRAVDLSRHPEAQAIEVRPHDLETYDELVRNDDDESEQ